MIDQWVMYNRVIRWSMIFALLPRRCAFSNRHIWFEYCYRGNVFITGPGEPVNEWIYLSRESFIVERLAGRIK
jgi:hypothetical protein